MSFTLRGRLETRLAAGLLPLAFAAALTAALADWWPLELAGLMLGVGLAADAVAYHRVLPYQPAWLALPLGLVELGVLTGLVLALGIAAPLSAALAFYACSWLLAQSLVHAGLPLWRLSYGDDGGELGAGGALAAAVVLSVFAFAGGVAWAQRPPTVHLEAGVHPGPLLIDRTEHLVGEPGAVVSGGIRVRADNVTVRGVTVLGGRNGIDVEHATGVVLENVTITGAALDGIHVRRAAVTIRNCFVESSGAFGQGIDISFASDLPPSLVEGCRVRGGQEGIVVDSANAMVSRNFVTRTSLRAITINEMGMGHVSQNTVHGALGVGIFCGDYSECMVEDNVVSGTRPDLGSGDGTRGGYGIVAHYHARVEVADNHAGRAAAFAGSEIERSR